MLSSEESDSAQATLNPEWSITCRTCLLSGETRSLYEREHDAPLSYADKVMLCTNMIVREHDNLPDRICVDCIEELEAAYRFRMNCDSSNAILQSYVATAVEKRTETEPLDSESEGADASEEIAIPLDSGILYTFKPPSGLNVKLIQRRPESANESPLHSTDWRDDILMDDENVDGDETIDEDCDDGDLLMISESESSLQVTDEGINKSLEKNFDFKKERSEKQFTYVYESVNHTNNELLSTEPDAVIKSKETEDGGKLVDSLSLGRKAENLTPSIANSVRTLKKIRKTNIPNELKPTIETVTTQPAADGSGIETVIRVKRNLSTTKQTHFCQICNTTYKYKHALETHLRRHRGDRPYKCEHCDKAFVVPFELRRHIRTHTGHKPYKCRYCDRTYSDFGSKTKHERTHTGERPYRCIYCWKTFSYSHVLNSHLLIHTGEKKYSCSTCGKRFAKSHHLKGHQKTHPNISMEASDGAKAEKNNTSELEFKDMLTESSTSNVMTDPALVDSYVNTSRLATGGWTLADVSLPLTETTSDGVQSIGGGSVVAIGAEELGNVSIVSFSDYMIKTESIGNLMMGGGSHNGHVATVHPHAIVDPLQDFVTVLLPKSESGDFDNMEIIDG